ncbi:MAG TPA: right-handed parallel beta-helix repeat-containing protein, partial [Spirochaetales bacterium]|nr:right-handed parallel beta-helix repeat-containing protein [Spirochaetales bacterium]
MKKHSIVFIGMLVLFQIVWAQQTITVSTVKDFIKAIGPNRVIELKTGTYNLEEGYKTTNQYIAWETKGNARELVIQNVKNLKIIGNNAVIAANSAYCEVIKIKKSSNIIIQDVTMVHTVTSPCMAGVLFLDEVQELTLNNCNFEGSGAVGITVKNSQSIYVTEGYIAHCTDGLIQVLNSSDCGFYMVSFYENYDLGTALYAEDIESLFFDSCQFYDNSGASFITMTGEDINFIACDFSENSFDYFIDGETEPLFSECYGEGNSFDEELYAITQFSNYNPFIYYELEAAGLSLYYPNWYEEEQRSDGIMHLFSSLDGIDLYAFEVYTLLQGENADTQFEALVKKAIKNIVAASGKLKITKFAVNQELELNTEAHPYYYYITANIVINGKPKKAFVKIVYNDNQKMWAFLLVCDNLAEVEDSAD